MRKHSVALGLAVMLVFSSFVLAQQGQVIQLGKGVLKEPYGICASKQMVFVTDIAQNAVFCFSPDGRLQSKFSGDEKISLKSPKSIAVSDLGEVFVADSGSGRVVVFDFGLKPIRTLAGPKTDPFLSPVDVKFYAGVLYVLDGVKRLVYKMGRFGAYYGSFGNPGFGRSNFANPTAIAFFGEKVVVCDAGQSAVKELSANGIELRSFGSPGTNPDSLMQPMDVEFDEYGNMYICDRLNHDILVRPASSAETFSFGRFGKVSDPIDYFRSDDVKTDFAVDAPGLLNSPCSLAFLEDCIYIADSGNGRVLVESLKNVWQQPRVDYAQFQKQIPDMPSFIALPSVLDFGLASKGDTRDVQVKVLRNQTHIVEAYVEGDPGVYVVPNYIIGASGTLKVVLGQPGKNISCNLVLKFGQDQMKVPIRGTTTGYAGFAFVQDSGTFAIMGDAPLSVPLGLLPQKGFVGEVSISVSLPRYTTSWAKSAKGTDDIVLSTVAADIEPKTLMLPESTKASLKINPIGKLRPGVYTFEMEARAKTAPQDVVRHNVAVLITSQLVSQKYATVFQETFTAHWCLTCGFHREAQYRLLSEYGQRYLLPVAYNTLDEGDVETTGMTQPENFERFKLYDGTGVPMSVFGGKVANISGSTNTDLRLAADRIRGRRYSGSTFEYWKFRATLDASLEYAKTSMVLSGTYDGERGTAWLKVDNLGIPAESDISLVFLLVEDGIYYYSENGEKDHHAVVRAIIKEGNKTLQIKKEQTFSFDFATKPMPEGFEINPERSRLVAFLQDVKTREIYGCTFCALGDRKQNNFELFKEKKDYVARPETKFKAVLYLVNSGNLASKYAVKTSADESISVEVSPLDIELGPVGGQTIELTIGVPVNWPLDKGTDVTIFVTDSQGLQKTIPISIRPVSTQIKSKH